MPRFFTMPHPAPWLLATAKSRARSGAQGGVLLLAYVAACAAFAPAPSAAQASPSTPLWPCSSAHRLPDADADAAPVFFQVLSAAGCECVFTLEGPPGSVLRLALGERAARGFYGVYPAAPSPPSPSSPPAWSGADCSRGAVRAFALAPSGELLLRATVCGPQNAAPPFVTETNVAVLTSTAPWGRLPLRVDVLRVRGPNATEELAPASPTPAPTPTPTPTPTPAPRPTTTTAADNLAITSIPPPPREAAESTTTAATTRVLPVTAASDAADGVEEQEFEAAITTPSSTTASATADTSTLADDFDYTTDESINLV